MKCILAAHNQGRGILRGEKPLRWMSILQLECGPFKGLKSPITMQRSSKSIVKIIAMNRMSVDDETAARGISHNRQVNRKPGLRLNVKNHVVRVVGRKHQGRAVRRKH